MPAVSCRCRFPSFLYRVYQPTLRRAEASPRACVALSVASARARARRSRNSQLWNGFFSVREVLASNREPVGRLCSKRRGFRTFSFRSRSPRILMAPLSVQRPAAVMAITKCRIVGADSERVHTCRDYDHS
jgi:hypothetical protein